MIMMVEMREKKRKMEINEKHLLCIFYVLMMKHSSVLN